MGSPNCMGLMFKPRTLIPRSTIPSSTGSTRSHGRQCQPVDRQTNSGKFVPARADAQSLAELGFVVVAIDGNGYGDALAKVSRHYYGNMGDNTLPDQVPP